MSLDSARDDLLDRGLDDILQLAEVISLVSTHTGIPALDRGQILRPTLDVIGEVLEAEWAIAGNIAKDRDGRLGVSSWHLDPSGAVRLIAEEWLGLDEPPNLGDVVWLELTEKGRIHARSLED